MAYEFIRYEQPDDGVALVTLNRPERLNALHRLILEELAAAVAEIEADDAIRVWLLTGAPRGDDRPCFSAGADLKAAAEGLAPSGSLGYELANDIDDMLKPSIAVVDGVCSTGGVELALACDFRLVGEAAQISDWHLKNLGTGLGGWGASTRWSRLVGPTKTKEIVLTGKVVGAAEAERIGFATAAHPSAELMDRALEMARTIAAMSPAGVRLTLSHLDRNQDMSRDQALRWAQLTMKWFGMSGSFEERAKRAIEKREGGA